jgi:CHAT domain-containing protein/Flp pilus assembly protein TadD
MKQALIHSCLVPVLLLAFFAGPSRSDGIRLNGWPQVQNQTEDRVAAAERWHQQGDAALDKDDLIKAIECYRKAVDLNVRVLVYVTDLAHVYRLTEKYAEARKLLDEQITKFAKPEEQKELKISLADTHFSWGDQLVRSRDRKEAIEHYKAALEIDRVYRQESIFTDLTELADAYHWLDQNDTALDYHQQALKIARELKDQKAEARILENIGRLFGFFRDQEKAFEYYTQALKIARDVSDQSREASVLASMGSTYEDISRYDKAIESYDQALKLARQTKDREEEGSILDHLGSIYGSLGQDDKAIEYFEQALRIARERDRPLEAAVISNLGGIYESLGQHEKAIDYYEHSLAISRELNDREGEATNLNNLGGAYDSLNQHEKAVSYYEKSLTIHRAVKDRAGEGVVLNNLAFSHLFLRQYDKSIAYLDQALTIAREVKDREFEGTVLSNLMIYWRAFQRPRMAIFYGKQSVNLLQEIRSNISGLEKNLQRSFLKSKEDTYRRLADALISEGRLPEAQQVLAMLKEEEYFEFVRRDATDSPLTARATLNSEEAALEEQYRKLADELTSIGKERGDLFAKRSRSEEEDRLLAKLDEQLAVAIEHFSKFLEQLQVKLGTVTAQGARVSEIKDALGMRKTLRELGSGTFVLYTLLGEDKYRVMLVTPDSEQAYENPVSAKALQRKVLDFRLALEDPRVDPGPLARELYDILIGPKLARDLKQAGAKTLMWSLDGVLRYLPVAALQDEQNKYLVETYCNVIFTPASLDRLKDPVSEHWKGLGLGVSKERAIFDDVSKQRLRFSALQGVTQELRAIIRDKTAGPAGNQGVLDGSVLLDESFTKDAMKAALRQNYQLVHIASHFKFQPGGDETASFLLLGDEDEHNSELTLAEIRKLSFEGVDLLTLSACETAMGDSKANGVEVESFGVLAQRQGAEAVMATLWPVADVSTPLLMREFYTQRETHAGMAKVEALQRAQLALLRGEVKDVPDANRRAEIVGDGSNKSVSSQPRYTSDPQRPFAHPYYWAPFILIGNWR